MHTRLMKVMASAGLLMAVVLSFRPQGLFPARG